MRGGVSETGIRILTATDVDSLTAWVGVNWRLPCSDALEIELVGSP